MNTQHKTPRVNVKELHRVINGISSEMHPNLTPSAKAVMFDTLKSYIDQLLEQTREDALLAFAKSSDVQRAIEMLNVAATFIRDHAPEGTIFYDEAECDGYCVADDCGYAAEGLMIDTEGNG